MLRNFFAIGIAYHMKLSNPDFFRCKAQPLFHVATLRRLNSTLNELSR